MNKQEYLFMIKEGKKQVKQFPLTVTKKNMHKTVLYQVKDLYYSLTEINRHLFNPNNDYRWTEYKLNVELNKTKKELDHCLKMCILYLQNQLSSIEIATYNNDIKFDEAI